MQKILVPLVLCTTLAGCSMIPDYSRPDLPVAENWDDVYEHALTADLSKAAHELPWHGFFQSSDLQFVIQTALDNNRDLKIAVLNIEATRALYNVEVSHLFPNLTAVGSSTRQKSTIQTSSAAAGKITSTYSANLAVPAYELDLFGKLSSASESAFETYMASKAAKDTVQISLIAEVAHTYLQYLADKKQWDLAQEAFASMQKSFEVLQTRYDQGIASKQDLTQAQQSLELSRQDLLYYKSLLDRDQNALVLLMGVQTFPTKLQAMHWEDVKILDAIPQGLSSKVLLIRPDVRQAEHELRSANADIGAARANFFPTISLTGALGYASTDIHKLFNNKSQGAWSFTPTATLPIFQAGRNIANLDYAHAVKDASVANYEQTIQGAFREVADALVTFQSLQSESHSQQLIVGAAKDNFDLSQIRYGEGIDNMLTLQENQRALLSAQGQDVSLQQQKLSNLITLYKVLGGGVLVENEEGEDGEG